MYYKASYQYLMNVYIKEYDLSKANISVLYESKAITKEDYERLASLDKHSREVEIGLRIRSQPSIFNLIQQGIKQTRDMFLKCNKIEEHQILYIDNDSISIIDKDLIDNRYTILSDYIEFKIKNIYTSMYRLGEIDFLYSYMNQNEVYRLKYVDHNRLVSIHKNGFLDFLLGLAYEQNTEFMNSIELLKSYYSEYIQKSLPMIHYCEFNSRSLYKFLDGITYSFYSKSDPSNLAYIDISYNAFLLRTLTRYITNEYFIHI